MRCLRVEPSRKLHRDEGLIAIFADFMDGADIGMVERGCGTGFTPKTFQGLRIAGQYVRQKLEGDETAQFEVLRFVDHTHAATAEFFEDAVVRDGLPNQR